MAVLLCDQSPNFSHNAQKEGVGRLPSNVLFRPTGEVCKKKLLFEKLINSE